MIKLFVAALAVIGCMFLLNAYAPSWWAEGFTIRGHLLPYAALAIGGVLYLTYKLKSK